MTKKLLAILCTCLAERLFDEPWTEASWPPAVGTLADDGSLASNVEPMGVAQYEFIGPGCVVARFEVVVASGGPIS